MLRKKILLIDDDLDLQDIMIDCLGEQDFELYNAVDGNATGLIYSIHPDLILMDVWLPGKKGSTCCLELKNDPVTRAIPVVLLSAVNELEKIARQCRADACINKPFDIMHLQQVVKGLLGI